MTVSAVIPTIGRPELRRAVTSVLEQTVPSTPIVVLDRPERIDEVRRYLTDLDYKLVVTRGRLGGAAARNCGVQESDTDVIAFLDDDDEWVTSKNSVQLEMLNQNQDSLICSRATLVGSETRVVPERLFDNSTELSSYLLDRSTVRLRRNFMQSSTLLMTRTTARAYPWRPELKRHQDWGLLIEMNRGGVQILTADAPLVRVYQDSTGSISRSTDWRASLAWLDEFASDASPRSRADFIMSVVTRSALNRGELAEVPGILRNLKALPHPAAVAVAAHGAVRLITRSEK